MGATSRRIEPITLRTRVRLPILGHRVDKIRATSNRTENARAETTRASVRPKTF
jgi:hypothetical protein